MWRPKLKQIIVISGHGRIKIFNTRKSTSMNLFPSALQQIADVFYEMKSYNKFILLFETE